MTNEIRLENGRLHDRSCEIAKEDECNCSCNGKYHRIAFTSKGGSRKISGNNLEVGDVVVCEGWERCVGKLGFVEEIVMQPDHTKTGTFYAGTYSIYGLEPENKLKYSTDDVEEKFRKMPYFGDFKGHQLNATGKKMTTKQIMEYAEKFSHNKGVQKDMKIVIANLGRKSGRNEGHEKLVDSL